MAAFWWQYELKQQENTKDLFDRVLPAVQWLSVRLVACLIGPHEIKKSEETCCDLPESLLRYCFCNTYAVDVCQHLPEKHM